MAEKQLKLVPSSDPVLRSTATAVADPRSVADLAGSLIAAMQAEGGVGLAAPQVGQGVRLFVSGVDGKVQAFVNPEITSQSDELIWWEEGCLSLPRLLGEVERPKTVIIKATDPGGQPITLSADGLLARVIQHEIDHLDGILFPDRMDDLSKLRTISQDEWETRFTNQSDLKNSEM